MTGLPRTELFIITGRRFLAAWGRRGRPKAGASWPFKPEDWTPVDPEAGADCVLMLDRTAETPRS